MGSAQEQCQNRAPKLDGFLVSVVQEASVPSWKAAPGLGEGFEKFTAKTADYQGPPRCFSDRKAWWLSLMSLTHSSAETSSWT